MNRVRHIFDTDITPVAAVRGPRQMEKTTTQLQIINDLLAEGVPPIDDQRVVAMPLSTFLLLG